MAAVMEVKVPDIGDFKDVPVIEVMVKAGDLFGDSVNIAARLQTSADADGICISAAAHDQVRKVLPLAFTALTVEITDETGKLKGFPSASR